MKDYVESGVISLSKTNGILKITNASKEKMQVVRQGISQIKTPYNFSRIDFADQHNE
ncbi:13123_t:CDS:1, partial [Rhizophagus irregularis]